MFDTVRYEKLRSNMLEETERGERDDDEEGGEALVYLRP